MFSEVSHSVLLFIGGGGYLPTYAPTYRPMVQSGRYASYWNAFLLPPANEVCEGYFFTRVFLSTGGGSPDPHLEGGGGKVEGSGWGVSPGPHPRGWGMYPNMHWGRHPPADGYCCGRYASYWNAFLFLIDSKVVCFLGRDFFTNVTAQKHSANIITSLSLSLSHQDDCLK